MEECIQVKIELGHKASLRAKPTSDGFTHDWTLFVRGSEGSNIQHFVERVVFHLHESFHKPKRVVKDPPYQISESGYAGFMMKIEVNFRNKEEPKRVLFDYDLFLQLDGPPISKLRVEKLTFNNPTEDFKRKVFQAGGVGILGSEGGLNPLQKPSPSSNSHCSLQSKPTKHVSEAIKAPKSSTISTVSVPSVNTTPSNTKEIKSTPVLQPPQTFVDLFGQPIKTSKASPDSQRAKDFHSKNSKNRTPATGSFSNEQSSCNSNITKDPKSSLPKETKDLKDSKKEKSAIKRPLSPLLPTGDSLQTKKRKIITSSNSSSKPKDGKDKKKSERKSSSKDKEKKEKRDKHKHGSDGGAMKVSTGEWKTSEMKSSKEMDINSKVLKKLKHPPSTSPSLSNSPASSETTKSSRSFKVSSPSPQRVEESPEGGCASPSSSISLSPMHHSRGHGPLGALMAAYEDGGSILSPMSSDSSSSPPHTLQEEEQTVPDIHTQQLNSLPQSPPSPPNPPTPVVLEKSEKPKVKEENLVIKEEKSSLNKDKVKRSKSKSDKLPLNNPTKKLCKMPVKEHVSREPTPESISDEYATELKELQRQIMTLRDRQHLQQIVNVIEETGLYKVTSTTFDFDLCRLDRGTVIKLQNCLATVL